MPDFQAKRSKSKTLAPAARPRQSILVLQAPPDKYD